METIAIRECRPSDVTAVRCLQEQWAKEDTTYGFVPATAEAIQAGLGPYLLVAECNGEIVGFAAGSCRISEEMAVIPPGETYFEVDDLYVCSGCRGQGLGGRMLERLLKAAQQAGVKHALVYSAVKDIHPVMRFYEQHGFQSWFVEMFKHL